MDIYIIIGSGTAAELIDFLDTLPATDDHPIPPDRPDAYDTGECVFANQPCYDCNRCEHLNC